MIEMSAACHLGQGMKDEDCFLFSDYNIALKLEIKAQESKSRMVSHRI